MLPRHAQWGPGCCMTSENKGEGDVHSTESATQSSEVPKSGLIDKKAVARLVSKLKKTLENPGQAGLELDSDGFLRLSALGGKFRQDKLAALFGETEPQAVRSRFIQAATAAAPEAFDMMEDSTSDDALVRLKGYTAPAIPLEARQEPTYMLAGAELHSLRVLLEKTAENRARIFTTHHTPGVPILFFEPRSIVEYRGVPNDPIIDMLHALHTSQNPRYQLAILTWVGADATSTTGLHKARQRAIFSMEKFGFHGLPVYAASGTRSGLLSVAELAATAMDTTAVVLNRGKEVLEASFNSRHLNVLYEIGLGQIERTTIWLYASQAARSTSSTGSSTSSRQPQDGILSPVGDSPESAAIFTCGIWCGVRDGLKKKNDRGRLEAASAVLVDTNNIAANSDLAALNVPMVSVEAIYKATAKFLPTDKAPIECVAKALPDAFSSIANETFESSTLETLVIKEAAKTRLSAAGVLVAAVLQVSGVAGLGALAEMIMSLAPFDAEQARLLDLVVHALSSGWVGEHNILAVLKTLYDSDIVEEEGVMRWWKRASADCAVVKKAEPFIAWLEQAEEEEEEED